MFPKPIPGKKKKVVREQDKDYIMWIHSWDCCVPGCSKKYPVQAHHQILKSQLGSDRSCVPLCADHHVGLYGIHTLGQASWRARFLIDLEKVVKEFNEKHAKGQWGPHKENAIGMFKKNSPPSF